MMDFNSSSHEPGHPREPARDEQLGALLRLVVGDASMDETRWAQLAQRVSAAVQAQQGAPWWSYAAQWQRRAVPLALAAGLIGALALFGASYQRAPESTSPDLVADVLAGTSSADAATTYARTVTGTMDLSQVVPE